MVIMSTVCALITLAMILASAAMQAHGGRKLAMPEVKARDLHSMRAAARLEAVPGGRNAFLPSLHDLARREADKG